MRSPAGQRGSVTAELAVGLVPVAGVLLLAGWLAAAGTAQVQVQLAAGAAARALARGEVPAAVEQLVQRSGGETRVESATAGGLVRVRVSRELQVPLLGAGVEVTGEAVAPLEAGEGPS